MYSTLSVIIVLDVICLFPNFKDRFLEKIEDRNHKIRLQMVGFYFLCNSIENNE